MARTKIDYGIDLGTTNSAISRMEAGEPVIKKSLDDNKDTMPSCISFNKKATLVGEPAFQQYKSERKEALSKGTDFNSFIEFKRTMGTLIKSILAQSKTNNFLLKNYLVKF